MKLKIDIAIGNEAMASGQDVAGALRGLADEFFAHGHLEAAWPAGVAGTIRDINGNRVGRWLLTPAAED